MQTTWTGVALLAAVCAVAYAGEDDDRVRYDGAQVYRVTGVSDDNKDQLVQLEEDGVFQRWGGNVSAIDVFVTSDNASKARDALEKLRFHYDVLIDNVQDAIDSENPSLSEEQINRFLGRAGHRLTFQQYHRMDDVLGYLDYLAQTYPRLVSTQTIGTSVKRHPLKIVKISAEQPTGKAIWIDGGTHAREWISIAAVAYIIHELVENRNAHLSAVRGIDFYILPLLNPDGYEYSHVKDRLWRKNRSFRFGFYGTDLNRNWDYKWGGAGTSKLPWKNTYPGPKPFSEPETTAVANFIQRISRNTKAFISFHSYGQYILYPWTYERRLPDDYHDLNRVGDNAANAIRNTEGLYYTVGSAGATLYPASGSAQDWAKGAAGIKYTYTIELQDKGSYGFLLPSTYIIPTAREALAAVIAIAQAVQVTP